MSRSGIRSVAAGATSVRTRRRVAESGRLGSTARSARERNGVHQASSIRTASPLGSSQRSSGPRERVAYSPASSLSVSDRGLRLIGSPSAVVSLTPADEAVAISSSAAASGAVLADRNVTLCASGMTPQNLPSPGPVHKWRWSRDHGRHAARPPHPGQRIKGRKARRGGHDQQASPSMHGGPRHRARGRDGCPCATGRSQAPAIGRCEPNGTRRPAYRPSAMMQGRGAETWRSTLVGLPDTAGAYPAAVRASRNVKAPS